MRGDVANVRAAVESAKHFFRERATGVTDQKALEQIATDVWERTCLGEVPDALRPRGRVTGIDGPR